MRKNIWLTTAPWTGLAMIAAVGVLLCSIIVILVVALFTDTIHELEYKAELMQSILVASSIIISLSGGFWGTAVFSGASTTRSRRWERASEWLYIAMLFGLLAVVFSVLWFVFSVNGLLVTSIIVFALQLGSFIRALTVNE